MGFFLKKYCNGIDILFCFMLKSTLPANECGWLFDRKEKERKDEAAREKSRECRMPTQVIMNLKIQMRIKAGDQTKLDYHEAERLNEFYHGEFDPGSERTLAARLKHASRTAREVLALLLEWRTGE